MPKGSAPKRGTTVYDPRTGQWTYAEGDEPGVSGPEGLYQDIWDVGAPGGDPDEEEYVENNYQDFLNVPEYATPNEYSNAINEAKQQAAQDFRQNYGTQKSAEELAWEKEKFGRELEWLKEKFGKGQEFSEKELEQSKEEFAKEFGLRKEEAEFEMQQVLSRVGREDELRQFAMGEMGRMDAGGPIDVGRTGEEYLYDRMQLPPPGQTYTTGGGFGGGGGGRTAYGPPVLDLSSIKELSDKYTQQLMSESRSQIDTASAEAEKAATSNVLARGMGRSTLYGRAKTTGDRARAIGSAARGAGVAGLELGLKAAGDIYTSKYNWWQDWFKGEEGKEAQGKGLYQRSRQAERERISSEKKTQLAGMTSILGKKY